MALEGFIETSQSTCYCASGNIVICAGSGQDAENDYLNILAHRNWPAYNEREPYQINIEMIIKHAG